MLSKNHKLTVIKFSCIEFLLLYSCQWVWENIFIGMFSEKFLSGHPYHHLLIFVLYSLFTFKKNSFRFKAATNNNSIEEIIETSAQTIENSFDIFMSAIILQSKPKKVLI